jgi:hypothetical protein
MAFTVRPMPMNSLQQGQMCLAQRSRVAACHRRRVKESWDLTRGMWIDLLWGGLVWWVDETGRTCSTHEAMGNTYKILVGKPQRKGTFGTLSRILEYNIKMDYRDIDCKGNDWIHAAQDTVQLWNFVNTVMSLRVP